MTPQKCDNEGMLVHTQTNTAGFSLLWAEQSASGKGGGQRWEVVREGVGGAQGSSCDGIRVNKQESTLGCGGIKHLPRVRLLRVDAKTLTILDFCCQCAANKCN